MSTTIDDPRSKTSRQGTTPETADSSTSSFAPARTGAPLGKKLLLGGLIAGGAMAMLLTLSPVVRGLSGPDQPLIFYEVKRGNLPITVTERGNLESQTQTEIVCEVDDYDRAGGNGTQIIYVVPNGKSVEEGELLVELDSAPLRDRLDEQILATERARAEQTQANAKFENQKTQNETSLEEAQLRLELAEMEIAMYKDKDDGTYFLALQELELKIQEAKNQIVEARAGLAMQNTDLEGIQMLYKLGYRGEGDLTQVKFKHLQAQDNLVRAINSLSNAIANRRKLEEYEGPMKEKELEGAVRTAERAVAQVKLDNESLLKQAEAAKIAADRSLVKEEEKLRTYRDQLEKCKIYAPHAGMVVYATENSRWNRGSSSMIMEGAFVRQRQKILTLPELTRMQVKTAVHESVVDKVHPGMRATIRVDAGPERAYPGSVKSVAVLPDQGGWLSSDVKVYETFVTIDESVEQLKPGMTAVVEIHVDRIKNVPSVPVQAIMQVNDDTWCYVESGNGVERRTVDLGPTNDKFVAIREGVKEGERVVLNPMALVDESEGMQSIATLEEEAEDNDPASTSSKPSQAQQGAARQDRRAGRGRGRRDSSGETSRRGRDDQEGGEGRRRSGFGLSQLDSDGDGKLSRSELPERMQSFFDRLDADGDGTLDAQEMAAMRNRARQSRKSAQ